MYIVTTIKVHIVVFSFITSPYCFKYLFRGFPVTRNSAARITVYSDGCKGMSGEVRFMEYVQLVLTMTYPKRGDIQIAMQSPLGNDAILLLILILHFKLYYKSSISL